MYHRMYHMCRGYLGKMVYIRTADGVYHGRLTRVTPTHAYLEPLPRRVSGNDDGDSKVVIKNAIQQHIQEGKGQEVLFFPFAFPLAAILGIGLLGAAFAGPWFWW